jgi:serine/threonine protein kinase
MQDHRKGSVEVFPSFSLLTVKAFARKIVRQIGQVTKSDIENESRVVKLLMENGGHENIVTILSHGFIQSFDYYYIDMELCDMTLKDYIDYWAGSKELPLETSLDLAPSVICNDCSLLLQMRNVWAIASQIAAGLEFMHSHHQIHRDLKPGNGNAIQSAALISKVLYSRLSNVWKLTDFGISAEATSKRAHTTRYARGSARYRAPELLEERPGPYVQ